jgi:hypothetical protein
LVKRYWEPNGMDRNLRRTSKKGWQGERDWHFSPWLPPDVFCRQDLGDGTALTTSTWTMNLATQP